MFVVAIEGKKHLFLNGLKDDFLGSLPAQFEVDEKDIEAFYIVDDCQKKLRNFMRNNPELLFSYDLENMALVAVDSKGEHTKCIELETKKVKKVIFKVSRNSVTGESAMAQDYLEFED